MNICNIKKEKTVIKYHRRQNKNSVDVTIMNGSNERIYAANCSVQWVIIG